MDDYEPGIEEIELDVYCENKSCENYLVVVSVHLAYHRDGQTTGTLEEDLPTCHYCGRPTELVEPTTHE